MGRPKWSATFPALLPSFCLFLLPSLSLSHALSLSPPEFEDGMREHSWPHIGIHAANPRYFGYRGKCTALISDAEHYGSLLNAGFDFAKYLQVLAANNYSHTQTFSGAYVEPDSDCNPSGLNPGGNTLSPANGSFIAPWSRTHVPGGKSSQLQCQRQAQPPLLSLIHI